MKLNQNNSINQGFTLIESLIALLVIAAFLILPALSLQGWQQNMNEDLFIKNFEKNLSATQQAAITKKRVTMVLYDKNIRQYSFTFTRYADIKEVTLKIPERITCQTPKEISFTPGSGNYSKLEVITFTLSRRNKVIKYQFQLGSGKYVKTITK